MVRSIPRPADSPEAVWCVPRSERGADIASVDDFVFVVSSSAVCFGELPPGGDLGDPVVSEGESDRRSARPPRPADFPEAETPRRHLLE